MIGADIAAALPLLQGNAESMQRVQGQVVRNGPLPAPDPDSGVITPQHQVIYSGPARIRPMKRVTDGGVTAGEATDSQSIYVVSLPITVTGVKPGDLWVTTGGADHAPLRVASIEQGAELTARRLTCELVQARSA